MLGRYGNAFSRIGKKAAWRKGSSFGGRIKDVSFSQCSVVTRDSVIDCGGAGCQWIVRPCSHLPDCVNGGIRVLGAESTRGTRGKVRSRISFFLNQSWSSVLVT